MDFADLFVFLVLIILFIYQKDTGEDYLSKHNSNALKGILSLVVILHHLSQVTKDGYYLRAFVGMGYLAVAAFFFVSGFGMMEQLQKRGDSYLKGYLYKKLPKVLFPYIIVTFIYYIYKTLLGEVINLESIKSMILTGTPIAKSSWYIVAIIYFYIVFYLSFRFIKNTYVSMGLVLVGTGAYILYCYNMGYGKWWYTSCLTFFIGVLWSRYRDQIDRFIEKRYCVFMIVCLIAYWGLKNSNWIVVSLGFDYILVFSLLVALASSGLYTIMLINIGRKINFSTPIFNFLGGISFEVYMLHGLFISLFRSKYVYITNDSFYILAVILVTMVSSYFFHILMVRALNGYSKLIDFKSRS